MSKLGDALERLELPDTTQAQLRMHALIEAQGQADARRRRRKRLGGALAGIVGAAAIALTPLGQAVADGVRDLVGIGDEPSTPAPVGEQSVVIGSGALAGSVPFEVVAQTNLNGRETCITVDFPRSARQIGAGSCIVGGRLVPLSEHAQRPSIYAAPEEAGAEAEILIQGIVPEGAAVTLVYETREGSRSQSAVYTFDLDDDLGQRIGVADTAQFFLAAVPRGVLSGADTMPNALTPSSVEETLGRIDYRVTGADGQPIADLALSELPGPAEPGGLLLRYPPARFGGR